MNDKRLRNFIFISKDIREQIIFGKNSYKDQCEKK